MPECNFETPSKVSPELINFRTLKIGIKLTQARSFYLFIENYYQSTGKWRRVISH